MVSWVMCMYSVGLGLYFDGTVLLACFGTRP